MSWAVVAWSWDRVYSDAEAAAIMMKASRLSDIDERLTWVVSHEVGRGEFDTVDASTENLIRFGLDRVTRSSHHGVAKSASLVTPRGPGLLVMFALLAVVSLAAAAGGMAALRRRPRHG